MTPLRCPFCAYEVGPRDETCPNCSKQIGGRTTTVPLFRGEAPIARPQPVGIAKFFWGVALLGAILGALVGIGGIAAATGAPQEAAAAAIGCLLAITPLRGGAQRRRTNAKVTGWTSSNATRGSPSRARLGDHFRLEKNRNLARCAIWTHRFGWELRLLVNEDLRQSQVCRSQDEVLETSERWRAGFIERGWGSHAATEDGPAPSATR